MSIDPKTIAAYEASRPQLAKQPFRSACYAPHTSMFFHTNGDVVACCKNITYVLGNVGTESLDQIWRGRKAEAMRKALREYKFGVGCEFCEWQIRGGQFDQVYATVFDPLQATVDSEWPGRMEFTVSNTCNLACIMCYGVLSSTIRAHREKLPPLPKVYGDQFFQDLRKYLPHLQSAKFFGGEPFLGQENYRIWDMMIEDGLKTTCHVTTNGTQWNSRVERVLEALPCHISVSMDGTTKGTVESVRVNADFDTVKTNIGRFLEYTKRRHTGLSLTFCLMRQNWQEFGDYLRFAEELGVAVFVNTVVNPEHTSLYLLPPEELLSIVRRMEEMDAQQGYSRLPRNGGVWKSGLDSLRKNADEEQRKKIAEHNRLAAERNPIAVAWRLVGEGKLEEALRVASEIPEQHRSYYHRLMLEGCVLRRLGRLEEARAQLDRAAEINRRGPDAFIERAWLNIDQRRYPEALTDARMAVENVAEVADVAVRSGAFSVLAHAHGHVGEFAEARRLADLSVATRPDNANMHSQRGWVMWHAKDWVEARRSCDRALELDPAHDSARRLRDLLLQQH